MEDEETHVQAEQRRVEHKGRRDTEVVGANVAIEVTHSQKRDKPQPQRPDGAEEHTERHKKD